MRYSPIANKYCAFPFVALVLLSTPLTGRADVLTARELLSHYQEMEAMNQDLPGHKPFRAGIYIGFMNALTNLGNGKDFCIPEKMCSCGLKEGVSKDETVGMALRRADPNAIASDVIIAALAEFWPCRK